MTELAKINKLTKAEKHQLKVMELVHSLGKEKAIQVLQIAVTYGYVFPLAESSFDRQGDRAAQFNDFRKSVKRIIDGPDPLDEYIEEGKGKMIYRKPSNGLKAGV